MYVRHLTSVTLEGLTFIIAKVTIQNSHKLHQFPPRIRIREQLNHPNQQTESFDLHQPKYFFATSHTRAFDEYWPSSSGPYINPRQL